MGVDVNERFDVQRAFIWETEVWILAPKKTLTSRVQQCNEIVKITAVEFLTRFSPVTTQRRKLCDIICKNICRKHCGLLRGNGLSIVSYLALYLLHHKGKTLCNNHIYFSEVS